jgi:hypothetical protein
MSAPSPSPAAGMAPSQTPGQTSAAPRGTAAPTDRPPWWPMLILLAVVIGSVSLFGGGRPSTRLVTLELMVGASALSVGALLGFLFGIPRTLTRDAPAEGGGAQGSGGAGDANAHTLSYQPSTNLEQVSDWLTKILIGVGLVEFDKASEALGRVGRRVQEQVGPGVPGADVLTQAVIIVLAVVGFLASFLWTRIYYGAIQAGADHQAVQALRAQVSRQAESTAEAQKKAEGAQKATEAMLRGEISVTPAQAPAAAPPAVPPQNGDVRKMAAAEGGWPPELRERVDRFIAAPQEWNADPTGDLFGDAPAAGNGRVLTAKVEAELGRGLMINLCLERTAGPPLQGPVTFLLHPTFTERVMEAPVRGDSAQTKIYSGGTFTVVAIADEGRTVLAFNLNRLSNAPDWFLAN